MIVALFGVLSLASIVLSLAFLEVRTDQNELVSTDQEYHRRYLNFLDEFGDQEFLYVVIDVDDNPERAAAIADDVASEIEALREHVKEVHHRVSPEAFGDQFLLLPQYDIEMLRGLVNGVVQNEGLLRRFAAMNRLEEVLQFFTENFQRDSSQDDPRVLEWSSRLAGILLNSMKRAANGEKVDSAMDNMKTALIEGSHPRDRGYLFTDNGELAFVLIMPQKDYATLEVIREPLRQIRAGLDRVRARFAGAQLGLTGRPVLQADEMDTTDRDMRRATIFALVLVVVLFALTFRRLRRPLLAGLALVVSITLTFGVATLTIGYLTLLSIVFAALLVGLGIDFGIHFLARYQDELRASGDIDLSIVQTLRTSGVGILTGGVTTAGAFYTAMFVHFKGLRELGFVAGTGVCICLATMLVFLPALVAISDHWIGRRRPLDPPHPIRVPGLSQVPRYYPLVLLGLGVPTVVGLFFFRGVAYNFNLLDLQAQNLESVQYELLLIRESDLSTWQAAYVVDSVSEVDDVIDRLASLRKSGVVGEIESVRDFVANDQQRRVDMLGQAAHLIVPLQLAAPTNAIDLDKLTGALEGLLDRVDTAQSQLAREGEDAYDGAMSMLASWVEDIETVQDRLMDEPEATLARLADFQVAWSSEQSDLRTKLLSILQPRPLTPDDLPDLVARRFVSERGRFVVYAYPRKDIWDETNMHEFVTATQGVSDQVTGTPLEVYESARMMKAGFVSAALYSVTLVFLFLLLDFRSGIYAVLAMVPLVMGLTWLLEIMPLFGLSFNLANFFALPILIGCGVDGGVHIVHRFQETHSTREVSKTTCSAVCLSFVTTIAGFGCLMMAQHRGVTSLGQVMALGCIVVLGATVFFLPAVIELAVRFGAFKVDADEVAESSMPRSEPREEASV